jgi:hypothetical protein
MDVALGNNKSKLKANIMSVSRLAAMVIWLAAFVYEQYHDLHARLNM